MEEMQPFSPNLLYFPVFSTGFYRVLHPSMNVVSRLSYNIGAIQG